MAVPFRRKSNKKIREGRSVASWSFKKKFSTQPIIKCVNCQTKKLLHQLCPSCLTYRQLNFTKKTKK